VGLPEKPGPSERPNREGRKRDLKRSIAEAAVHCLRQGMTTPPMSMY
jgi:hypothetical protein